MLGVNDMTNPNAPQRASFEAYIFRKCGTPLGPAAELAVAAARVGRALGPKAVAERPAGDNCYCWFDLDGSQLPTNPG